MSQDELDAIGKSIDEYNLTAEEGGSFHLEGNAFFFGLKALLAEANKRKWKEPKSTETRYWAVVYTDLEKVLAYVNTYIEEE